MICPVCEHCCQSLIIDSAEYNSDFTKIRIKKHYSRCYHRIEEIKPVVRSRTKDGYILVTGWDSFPTGNIYLTPVGEHRAIWERAHGKLAKGSVVHHINGIKDDNRLENLVAMPKASHSKHMKQEEPFEITCPHCNTPFKMIKQTKARYMPVI